MTDHIEAVARHIPFGDQTIAKALEIAHLRLNSLGWKYNKEDIGAYAGAILKGIQKGYDNDKSN